MIQWNVALRCHIGLRKSKLSMKTARLQKSLGGTGKWGRDPLSLSIYIYRFTLLCLYIGSPQKTIGCLYKHPHSTCQHAARSFLFETFRNNTAIQRSGQAAKARLAGEDLGLADCFMTIHLLSSSPGTTYTKGRPVLTRSASRASQA